MLEWEYTRSGAPDLNALGREGWELVAIQNGEHLFKRPAPSAIDRFTREQTARALLGTRTSCAPPRVLNPELAALIRRIGHTQMLLVCDGGFPVPFGVPGGTLDLSVTADVPTVAQVLDAILPELPHDRVILASEMKECSPERYAWHEQQKSPIECHSHLRFKQFAREAVACVRTGDATPYANVIVVGG